MNKQEREQLQREYDDVYLRWSTAWDKYAETDDWEDGAKQYWLLMESQRIQRLLYDGHRHVGITV